LDKHELRIADKWLKRRKELLGRYDRVRERGWSKSLSTFWARMEASEPKHHMIGFGGRKKMAGRRKLDTREIAMVCSTVLIGLG
jgi:hypothetical protein